MMTKQITREQKVCRFHQAMELDVDSQPRVSLLQSRKKLLLEEVFEAVEAIDILSMEIERGKKGTKEQWANLLKELADVQYIVSGTGISFNTFPGDFDVAFRWFPNRKKAENFILNNGNTLTRPSQSSLRC